jgi:endonuclease/exonuclease/phosphatase family metal-dependent hydrolase
MKISDISFLIVIVVLSLSIFRFTGYFTEPKLTDAEIHAVIGEPSITAERGPVRALTVVTWNIERGVRFERIESVLERLSPDVVLLQEVDRGCNRSGDRDVARELSHRLGMNWTSAGEFQEIGEGRGDSAATTGQAILSRYPISDVGVIPFTEQVVLRWRLNPAQPRRGGRIALRAHTAGLEFYNLHLESGGDDELRTSQLGEVLDDEARRAPSSAVIAGDFNNAVAFQSFMFADLSPAGFTDALGTDRDRKTSVNHRHPIDWIFLKGAHASGHVERIEDASDHYPLVTTITFGR